MIYEEVRALGVMIIEIVAFISADDEETRREEKGYRWEQFWGVIMSAARRRVEQRSGRRRRS